MLLAVPDFLLAVPYLLFALVDCQVVLACCSIAGGQPFEKRSSNLSLGLDRRFGHHLFCGVQRRLLSLRWLLYVDRGARLDRPLNTDLRPTLALFGLAASLGLRTPDVSAFTTRR